MLKRYARPIMEQIWSDENKFGLWLNIEIAACEGWAKMGAISEEDMVKIRQAKFNFVRMNEILQETHHDVTAFLGSVYESLGPESRFIHMGMTSSDVMDTSLSIQCKQAADVLLKDIDELIVAIEDRALEHKYTVMVGRSHGIHAEPISFGLKMAIWLEETKRNKKRLEEAKEVISVGQLSGPVGTFATIPPQIEEEACSKLGLKPAPVSSQIIQRDRHAQFLTTLALIACSLEKFANEIRLLQKTETREVEEPFERGQTGSSSMPHKRNPELCERICGLARVIRGHSLTSMENIALWHERDISHSSTERITLPDATALLDYMLSLFTKIVNGMYIYPERMQQNLNITNGLIFSQRVMLAMIDKGLKRNIAYKIVQRNAMKSWETKQQYKDLLLADQEASAVLSEKELDEIFDTKAYLKYVDYIYDRIGLGSKTWVPHQRSTEGLAPRSI